jgi:hypothetical protein
MVRAWGLVVAAAVALAACAGDDAEDRSRQPYEERSGLESTDVLEVLCDSWATDRPDRPTVNEYVRDLLMPLDLVNDGTPFAYSADDIDTSVLAACRTHGEDPAAFLAAVRNDLGLSQGSLDALTESACARYRVQQSRMAGGDWSGEDIATFVRELAADGGASLQDLRQAIDGICAD